jgi:hypothetical protein
LNTVHVGQYGKETVGSGSENVRIFPVGNRRDNATIFRPDYCFRFLSISGAFLTETVIFPELPGRFRKSESSFWMLLRY